MTVLVVTVAGPSGRRDLAVPAGVPVGDLLGPVAAALAGDDPPAAAAGQPDEAGHARWRLAPLGEDPLPPERSLAACGIGDGAILTLTPDPSPTSRGAAASPTSTSTATATAPRLRRCAVVGVVSAAAGTGRTTVAALLAAVLAATCQGPTVAVDAHPGPGSLSNRLAPGHAMPAGDLLGLLDHPAFSSGELLACLGGPRPGGPVVVGVGGSPAPGRRAWSLLVRGLARHADALVLDCGPGLADQGARAAVATADQLVLVTEPAPASGSRRVAGALADLGHAVVVVAAGAGSGGPGRAGLASLLPGVRGVVPLPPPGALPPREWAEVPPWWRRPALELASLLVADWPALGITAAGG